MKIVNKLSKHILISRYIESKRGVRQGCVLSTVLVLLCSLIAMREVSGIKVVSESKKFGLSFILINIFHGYTEGERDS